MKILVVDDNKESLYLLETLLKGNGYEVASAINGMEALEKLRANGFDIIVSDILMPVMDGFRLCRECKEDEKLKDIPFVFYTATYIDEKDEELALKVGADKFIRKPAEPEEFIKIIQGVIRDVGEGRVGQQKPVVEEEKEVFKLYSERLVNKLEKKMLDLEAEIARHKQAEGKLKESEEDYRKLIETSPYAIFVHIDQKIIFMNPAGLELLGAHNSSEVIGKSILDFTHPDYLEVIKRRQELLKKGDAPRNEYFKAIRLDGSVIDVEIAAARRMTYQGKSAILSTLHDVTDRLKAEELIEKSRTQYRDIVNNSVLGMAVYVPGQPVVFTNKRMTEITGYSVEEIESPDFNFMVLFTEEDQRLITANIKRRFTGEYIPPYESMLISKTGDRKWVLIYNINTEYEGESAIQVQLLDVTEHKQAEEELKRYSEKLQELIDNITKAIALTTAMRDPYTSSHQQRVTQLACAIAEEMGLSKEMLAEIRVAGSLHDIGKMYIPSEILTKPGRLTETEFDMIKTHSKVGFDILKTIDFPWPIAPIVLQHHERADGSGYPSGISAKDVLPEARILAVADVVEAMASHRPYRPAHGIDKALEEISQKRGTLYDPEVVDICLRLFKEKGFKFE